MTVAISYGPETVAKARAHARRARGSCASDLKGGDLSCDCVASDEERREAWAARARMARARQAAGVELDADDIEALAEGALFDGPLMDRIALTIEPYECPSCHRLVCGRAPHEGQGFCRVCEAKLK